MCSAQFAKVPNKSSISNTCCVYAISAMKYWSFKFLLSAAKVSDVKYGNQPYFIQSFLTLCQRQSSTLSDVETLLGCKDR